MDFILNEAEIDELKFEFSDSESEMECESSPSSEDECFINDASSDEDEREKTALVSIGLLIIGKNLNSLKTTLRTL